jgi:hypothetical protein
VIGMAKELYCFLIKSITLNGNKRRSYKNLGS